MFIETNLFVNRLNIMYVHFNVMSTLHTNSIPHAIELLKLTSN